MGRACSLFRATAADVERLIAAPDALEAFLEEIEGPPIPVREVRPKGILGFLLRLTPVRITEVDPAYDRGDADDGIPDPDRMIDIDKAWEGLHVLFTGTAYGGDEPACYLAHGGADLDDEGFTRALRPEQARQFAAFLASLTPDELRRRSDAARVRTPGPIEGLLDAFTEVQTFLAKVAAVGDGVIIRVA